MRDACLEELTDAECRHLVAERHLGRLALSTPKVRRVGGLDTQTA